MVKVYYVSCPQCRFRFYVGEGLVNIPDFPAICPKCHTQFQLEDSPSGVEK